MHDFKRIAQLLRSLGAKSEAEALERIPTSGSGIRLSQIFYDRDAPEGGFYDASEKLRNFAPATDPEKAWFSEHHIVSPHSRQRVKNYFHVQDKKTRTQREDMYPPDERWGEDVFDDFLGEDAWGHGPLYRHLPEMAGEGAGMRGHEVPGMEGTYITDIDPGHPTYTHEDKRGKRSEKPLDEYELGLPDERIGTFSLEEGYRYRDLENTDPRVVTHAHTLWTNAALQYAGDVADTAGRLNKNFEDWIPTDGNPLPRWFHLLATQFMNNVNIAITGNRDGNYRGERGSTVLGAIDRRLDSLAEMRGIYESKREATAPISQRQSEVFEEYLDEVSRGPSPGHEAEWFDKLKLIYAGSVKLMILDPLGLSEVYPEGLKRVLGRHQAVHGTPNLPEWRTRAEAGPTPKDLIERPWQNVQLQTPGKRKVFEDIPTYTGPMTDDITGPYQKYRDTGEVSPSVGGQVDAVLASLEFEQNRLVRLKKAAENLVVARNNGGLPEINAAVLEFFLRAGELYGSTGFVTQNDAINMTYGIGDDSKMEIFIKAMYIGKAWQTFVYKLLEEGEPQMAQEFDAGLEPPDGGEDDLHG